MKRLLAAILAFSAYGQSTYTAHSCSQADVNDCIASGGANTCSPGGSHTAINGDMIQIPSGSCTWSSGVVVPSHVGITITGAGTPNSGSSTSVPNASCTATDITVSSGATLFTMTPEYGNATSRLSCMEITSGTGSGIALSAEGVCTSSGCPNLRMDNITYTNWAGHVEVGISYGINAVGDMFGVVDHNIINGVAGNYIQLIELSHAAYLGVGFYGDNSWHLPEGYGTANFLFFENNTFNDAGCCENEGDTGGGLQYRGGGRPVARYNIYNTDEYNAGMSWHGTESNGRARSGRAMEFYNNTFNCPAATVCQAYIGIRGGTGLAWGNLTTFTPTSGIISLFDLTTYRTTASIGGWGPCDGSAPYDTNDGVTYYSGSIGSVSGSDPYTITVSGASPGWTTNQWTAAGAPYSIHDITQSNGWEIASNGAATLTTTSGGGPGSWVPAPGDTIQILRATVCIDQAGGRGAGILYNSADSPANPTPANEVPSPAYAWLNTLTGGSLWGSFVYADTARVIQNRDYYAEVINQAAQSSPTVPFSGTGIGHGTLANQPTTCTASTNGGAVGSAYWETDHGQLDYCIATNTWSTRSSSPASYVPYVYPHPLDTGFVSTTTAKSSNVKLSNVVFR